MRSLCADEDRGRHPSPDMGAIRRAMSGNLCRCGAYAHIFKAVQRAGALRRKEGRRGFSVSRDH
jgi:xanthine dehydrogenase iron-sulfur cluster and FAD-binding subunit A